MTDKDQHLVENETTPEQSNLIIQEQQDNENLIQKDNPDKPNIVHVNGKSPELQQETIHSNESGDESNSTQLANTMEQLNLQSSTNSSSVEDVSQETEGQERYIPSADESPSTLPQEETEEYSQTSEPELSTNTLMSIGLPATPDEITLLPEMESVTDPSPTAPDADRTETDTCLAYTEETANTDMSATTLSKQVNFTAENNHITPIPQHTTASTSTTNNNNAPVRSTNEISTASVNGTHQHLTSPSSNSNNNRGRSVSSVNPSTTSSGLLPRSQRVWEMDRQAPECRRCHRRFNFLLRRHHCRRCGQIVCDKCSSHRIRLPVEELIEDPMVPPSQYPLIASQSQRVCDTCYREPIRRSSDSQHQRRSHRSTRPVQYGSQMRRTDSSQSLMIDCPVCSRSFLGMQKSQQEEHLQECLNVGSPPVQAARYIVYKLSEDSTQTGDECPICFEEFKQGDKISRMICLCSYHQHCLASWLERGKGCPVHYDYLHNAQDLY